MKLWSPCSEKSKFSAFSYLIVQLTSAKLCPLIKDDKRDILLLWSSLSPNMNEVTALHPGCSFLLAKTFFLVFVDTLQNTRRSLYNPSLRGANFNLEYQALVFMSSLCGVGVRVRVNNFSKTTRPRDMLFFLKDTSSIEDEKVLKACKSACSSVC